MSPSLPLLYSFRRCPYAMRARLALYTARIPHEHREVDLKDKPREMLDISPKGTVPVLQLTDGTILEQSLDIMQWALKTPVLPEEDAQLVIENDTHFKHALDRYKYPGRYPEDANGNPRAQCEEFLKKIEGRLHPFLTGAEAALVDMVLFPFVRQFAMVDPSWFEAQAYLHIKAWLGSFHDNDVFPQVMESHPVWMPDHEPTEIRF